MKQLLMLLVLVSVPLMAVTITRTAVFDRSDLLFSTRNALTMSSSAAEPGSDSSERRATEQLAARQCKPVPGNCTLGPSASALTSVPPRLSLASERRCRPDPDVLQVSAKLPRT